MAITRDDDLFLSPKWEGKLLPWMEVVAQKAREAFFDDDDNCLFCHCPRMSADGNTHTVQLDSSLRPGFIESVICHNHPSMSTCWFNPGTSR